MSLRVFYLAIASVLATVAALSFAWEFWLEDFLLDALIANRSPNHEDLADRWEFVLTSVAFSTLALLGPTFIGTRVIQRDKALHQAIVRLSQQDDLTGLLNRRRVTELLDSEVQRAARYGTGLSVILIDIDHFKAINDRFGHQTGDWVLTRIAEVVRSAIRATDLAGRWGGEEFVIVLPQTNAEGALALAEKMRERLESTDLGEVGRKTASFGVTSFVAGDDASALVGRADAGMYQAKQGGRNRVELVSGNAA